MRQIESMIEKILFYGRWLLAPMYVGLTILLIFLAVKFFQELIHLVPTIWDMKEENLILTALALVDLVLTGNLLVMVILSGYEIAVSRIDVAQNNPNQLSWMGKVDTGTLKLKLSVGIVAISSIHLLKAFVEAHAIDNTKLIILVVMHLTFVVSALLLAWVDKIAFASHRDDH